MPGHLANAPRAAFVPAIAVRSLRISGTFAGLGWTTSRCGNEVTVRANLPCIKFVPSANFEGWEI